MWSSIVHSATKKEVLILISNMYFKTGSCVSTAHLVWNQYIQCSYIAERIQHVEFSSGEGQCSLLVLSSFEWYPCLHQRCSWKISLHIQETVVPLRAGCLW